MTGPAFTSTLWTVLALLTGGSCQQYLQQQYIPIGRYFGQQWTFVTRTLPLDGQPSPIGILVTRTHEGFLAYDQNQQITSDPNQIPVSIAVVDTQPSIAEDGNPAPQSRIMGQPSGTDGGLSGAIESQTGLETGAYPVKIDAEEKNNSHRKKRDLDNHQSWKVFTRLNPSTFFSDRSIRDIYAARAKRAAFKGISTGITERRIVPVAEDINEMRYRRGTDDNLRASQYYYRSPRNAEVKTTSWSTSAGFEGSRNRRDTKLYFPILTDWFAT